MKYKIGDWVIYTHKKNSEHWKNKYGISLYGKTVKIIHIDSIGEEYCLELEGIAIIWFSDYEFESINHLKLKKLLNK